MTDNSIQASLTKKEVLPGLDLISTENLRASPPDSSDPNGTHFDHSDLSQRHRKRSQHLLANWNPHYSVKAPKFVILSLSSNELICHTNKLVG